MTIPAVILAGGKATRMGGKDKTLLTLGGVTLLDRIIARLRPDCAPVAVNANGDPRRFRGQGLPVLADSAEGQPGPLAGILAAMDWAAGIGAAEVLTVAGDTPFFPADLPRRLAQSGGLSLAASQAPDETPQVQPTFGLWPVSLRERLRVDLAAGDRKVRKWAHMNGAVEVVFPHFGLDPFFNINTPEDLRTAKALMRGDQCFRMK